MSKNKMCQQYLGLSIAYKCATICKRLPRCATYDFSAAWEDERVDKSCTTPPHFFLHWINHARLQPYLPALLVLCTNRITN